MWHETFLETARPVKSLLASWVLLQTVKGAYLLVCSKMKVSLYSLSNSI